MKNTIAMINALKYYNEDELTNDELYKEKLAEDIDTTTYNKMIQNMYGRRFLLGWMLSNQRLQNR